MVSRERMKNFPPNYDKVFDFSDNLKLKNRAIWEDCEGITEVVVGNNIIQQNIDNLCIEYILISSALYKKIGAPLLQCRNNNSETRFADYIVSIGSALEHNSAREFIFNMEKDKRPQLITIPFPLANDSFGTNRSNLNFGQPEKPSRETSYPSYIFIDLRLLDMIDWRLNLIGLGEIIGLYYSIYDYHTVNKLSFDQSLLEEYEKKK